MNNIPDESDSNDISCMSSEVLTLAVNPKPDVLPKKSKESYQQAYVRFSNWCKKKKFESYTEDILLEYFIEKSKLQKSSTLWSIFSMLKASLALNDNIDMGRFVKLKSFLRNQSNGYQAKQCKPLTREEINKFMLEAPDNRYLMMKVALIMGVTGACNTIELTGLSVHNIEDLGAAILVKIVEDKTKMERTFIISGQKEHSVNYIELYRKYAALRPASANHSRFFLKYENGRCSAQVVGIHTMGKVPYQIAKYLNLPNPAEYTGHCFRKCSATKLGNNRGLKRQRVWKSIEPEDILKFLPLDKPIKEEYININNYDACMDISDNNTFNETLSNDALAQTAVDSEFESEVSDNDFTENGSNTNYFKDVGFDDTVMKQEHISDNETCDYNSIDMSNKNETLPTTATTSTTNQSSSTTEDLNVNTEKNLIDDSKAMYREKKLHYLQRQAEAAEKLADGIKKNYHEEKLKLIEREVVAKEKIASALLDLSQKLLSHNYQQ